MFIHSLHSKEEIHALKVNCLEIVPAVSFFHIATTEHKKILENVSQSLICECTKDQTKEKLS